MLLKRTTSGAAINAGNATNIPRFIKWTMFFNIFFASFQGKRRRKRKRATSLLVLVEDWPRVILFSRKKLMPVYQEFSVSIKEKNVGLDSKILYFLVPYIAFFRFSIPKTEILKTVFKIYCFNFSSLYRIFDKNVNLLAHKNKATTQES